MNTPNVTEQSQDANAGCVQRVVLLRLVAKWRDYQKRTLDCAKSNKANGDHNADNQLRAQAFGTGLCADELEELAQQNAQADL